MFNPACIQWEPKRFTLRGLQIWLDNISPILCPPKPSNIQEWQLQLFLGGFWKKQGSNIIHTQFLNHICNPLIKANLLDTQNESGMEHFFFASHIIFEVLSLVREPKKQFFYGQKMIFLRYLHPMARDQLQKLGTCRVRRKMKRPSMHCKSNQFYFKQSTGSSGTLNKLGWGA